MESAGLLRSEDEGHGDKYEIGAPRLKLDTNTGGAMQDQRVSGDEIGGQPRRL